MLIGYARVSKADGSQSLDLQHDALTSDGVEVANCYAVRIPTYPPTHSDSIRPLVPGYPPTCDALR